MQSFFRRLAFGEEVKNESPKNDCVVGEAKEGRNGLSHSPEDMVVIRRGVMATIFREIV